MARRGGLFPLLCLVAAGVLALRASAPSCSGFALLGSSPSRIQVRPMRTAMAAEAFESGKVNVGAETTEDATLPEDPRLACDEECVAAINDCLSEGCSVDALLMLDSKLANGEKDLQSTIEEVSQVRKTALSVAGVESKIARLTNMLQRIGGLRGQLRALKGASDNSFVEQLMKAAAVAFGGSRPNDYPKVGVSSYSS
eukprot:CAMPEP_0117527536 /NCGR_PEP_ID=MMETSP0784-20121206/36850_1 /TAXON_ID=39447 /ORGANISM="" /LENGTH=197 /DNA_ID=CAMNT_0005323795 /DNA_START=11 /DNA_END=604 /DNA_ORIENTATION=-